MYDEFDENITYSRANFTTLKLKPNTTLKYGLVPRIVHEISFLHVVGPLGFAGSHAFIMPSSRF